MTTISTSDPVATSKARRQDSLRLLQPARLVASLLAGLVIGLSAVISGMGVAALVFPGPLQAHLFAVIGGMLFGSMVMLATTALGSSYAGSIGQPQQAPAAILGLLCGALLGPLGEGVAPAAVVPALLVAVAASTLVTGVCTWLLGTFRLGGLIRFIPYPVIGGVLAGLGWLMIQGALSVVTGIAPSLEAAPALLEADNLARILVGLAVGVLLFTVTRRVAHYLVLPGLLVASVAGFYLVAFVTGVDAAALGEGGWLLGPFPRTVGWAPLAPAAFAALDWWLLAQHLPIVGTLVLVTAISLLLHASAIELAVGRDLDLDRELRTSGLANGLAGLVGGVPGFHAVSPTILAHQVGAAGRLTGLVAALVVGGCLFFGFEMLALFPRPVLGGLLLHLGLSLLHSWVYRTWRELPRGDYAIVAIILLVSAWFGYLEAIGTGIIAGVVLFTVSYSRVSVTKHAVSGAALHSNVDRAEGQRRTLERLGGHVHVLVLQGFLFFGTASKVLERIRARADAAHEPRLLFVVLDFRLVSGLDSSSLMVFRRLEQLARERRFQVLLTQLPDAGQRLLRNGGVGTAPDGLVRLFPDLDHGLEWCEERLLQSLAEEGACDPNAIGPDGLPATFAGTGIERYLEDVELPAETCFIRQGDPSDDMYFVRDGRVTVRLEGAGRGHRLRTYGPGTIVGEIAMYTGTPRSASVVTETSARLSRLTRDQLRRLTEERPAAAAVLHEFLARSLSQRLTNTNRLLNSVL